MSWLSAKPVGRREHLCACEPGFTCSRCAGTWLTDDYPELPDEGEAELRYGGGEREASEGEE